MQVNKINSMNTFSGLWQNTDKKVGKQKHTDSPIFEREAVYRPFKNETPAQIKEAIEQAKNAPVWECDDDSVNDPYGADHYIIVKPKLGEKLNITEDEYEEIKQLDTSGTPKTRYPLYYSQTKYIPEEVQEKM